jgi:spermidine synthase
LQTTIPKYSVLLALTGAAILGLELIASRYMAPMFGSSLYVWGAILSITLICLAAGYSWGGRLGERLEKPIERLVLLILLSATWVSLLPFCHRPVALLGLAAGPTAGPLIVNGLLFAAPILALATATPLVFAENNRLRKGDCPTTLMGDLFAISTIGSVAGALITAYLLIPQLGLRSSFFCIAGLLFIACIPHIWSGIRLRTATMMIMVVALISLSVEPEPDANLNSTYSLLHRTSSQYAEIAILEDRSDASRVLLLDGTSQNWVSGTDYDVSKFDYITVMLDRLSLYSDTQQKALVLGLGAGVISKNLIKAGFDVDTIEIDPVVLELAIEYFKFDPDQEVHIGDAAAFLKRAQENNAKYDVILHDVTGTGVQPGHLVDVDAFELMKSLLTNKGVLVTNQVSILKENRNQFALHTLSTLNNVFADVRGYDVQPRDSEDEAKNFVVFAANYPPVENGYISQIGERLYVPELSSTRVLSSDWNPVNLWSVEVNGRWHKNIRRWLGDGAVIPI